MPFVNVPQIVLVVFSGIRDIQPLFWYLLLYLDTAFHTSSWPSALVAMMVHCRISLSLVTGWHSEDLWHLTSWYCLSGLLVFGSIFYPVISASHCIWWLLCFRHQLLVFLSAQPVVRLSMLWGKDFFFNLTWGSRSPSQPGETSCCFFSFLNF